MNRRGFLKSSSTTATALAVTTPFAHQAAAQGNDGEPTFRRPKTIIPVPTPSPAFQRVAAGVPNTRMTREATGLLREFSTPVLINHSHRVFFWANEMGRQTGQKFDVELVFICAAFHDFGLLKKFSSANDRFEVDSANAVRQFLEHHDVPNARIQTAWDAISLHTTPGIAAYKPLEGNCREFCATTEQPRATMKVRWPANRTAAPDALVPWPSTGLCESCA
jgi:HD domain